MRPDDGDYRAWQLQRDLDRRGDPREPMWGWDAVCADHEQMSAEIARLQAAKAALAAVLEWANTETFIACDPDCPAEQRWHRLLAKYEALHRDADAVGARYLAVVEAARALTDAVCKWRALEPDELTDATGAVILATGDAMEAIFDLAALDGGAGEAADDAS